MDQLKAQHFVFDLLKLMKVKGASDLFITAGFPPAMKLDGKLAPVSKTKLSAEQTNEICFAVMDEKQSATFRSENECNFSIGLPSVARFRVNAFIQRGSVGLVFRTINSVIPKIDDLGLPPAIKEVALMKRGLMIVVGATGSGKSTTLASMVDHRNTHSHGHIVTIEDPIEFMHDHGNCIVTQREVGVDTDSWNNALKNTLRQAPDVILIGEIRDRETMDYAIAFAETGHLCMATLHANSTNQALDRIINFFPEERRHQLLTDLSLNTRAFISQRLIPKQSGNGRVAAVEVMLNSPLISDLIYKGDVHEIKSVMAKSQQSGMQTFDQALFDLYEAGDISYDEALKNADSQNEVRLKIKLESKRDPNKGDGAAIEEMGIV